MRDPYQVLGLPKTASLGEIKKAYRKLAKANHPDQTKDPKAKERFNEATLAYDLLGDEKKRAAFDRGEIDMEGKPRHPGFEGFDAGGARGKRPAGFEHFEFNVGGGRGAAGGFDPADIFADLFSSPRGQTRSAGARVNPSAAGADVESFVTISLIEAVKGTNARVTLPNGRTLEARIPAGIEDGKQIRLKGQGQPGAGGDNGDAIVTIRIAPHPLFEVDGRNLRLEWPVTLYEAALGARIEAPTLDGAVEINVPPGAHGGKPIRLRGKGLPGLAAAAAGDLLVKLKIVLPEALDPDLVQALETLRNKHPYAPRKGLM